MTEKYRQCTMKSGEDYTVGFIPEHAAKLGNQVELVDLDNKFYEVIAVGFMAFPKEIVKSQERLYKSFQVSTKGGGIDQ